VRYVLKHERARSVADVARRTRLGLGACGGMRCAGQCGQIVAQELSLSPCEGRQQALEFLIRQAAARAVALGPEQARQEALAIASVRSQLGVSAQDEDEALAGVTPADDNGARGARDGTSQPKENAWSDRSS
jgi:glycerol-3-phosphate dehydrogenase